MLDCTVFALADQSRSGQDDRQHRDGGDDVVDGAEPGLVELRVEARSQRKIDLWCGARTITRQKLGHLAGRDGLDVAAPGEGLRHPRRVHVELDRRRSSGQQIALEVGRNVQGKDVEACIQARHHVGLGNELGDREIGRIERRDDPRGNRRIVLIDHGKCGPIQRLWLRPRRCIDRKREGIDDQDQECRIPRQSPQFLQAELDDVGNTHV